MAAPLFRTLLGAEFRDLDPLVQWVHSGESRILTGAVTVHRGESLTARLLSMAASLPPSMSGQSIEVEIDITAEGERWTRCFGVNRRMKSRLSGDGRVLIERLGMASLSFLLTVQNGELRWTLQRITVLGVPLPLRWFTVSATIKRQSGRYHFFVDSAVRGVGRIIRYEGALNAYR